MQFSKLDSSRLDHPLISLGSRKKCVKMEKPSAFPRNQMKNKLSIKSIAHQDIIIQLESSEGKISWEHANYELLVAETSGVAVFMTIANANETDGKLNSVKLATL